MPYLCRTINGFQRIRSLADADWRLVLFGDALGVLCRLMRSPVMVTFSVLLNTLKESSKRLPVLRFAWALVGLSAVAALAIRMHGEGKAAILATSFALIGFVLLVVAAYAARAGARLSRPAMCLIWSITAFFIIFLFFTLTAFAFSFPCNWVLWLSIRSEKCMDISTGSVDYTRVVDFTRLHCLPDGRKNDDVVYTDVIKFLDTPPPSWYYRKFNYDYGSGASVKIRDLIANQDLAPTVAAGGNQQYGSVSVQVDATTKEAHIEWRYLNVHSGDPEGVGFTPSAESASDNKARYVIRNLNVTYRLPPGIGLEQRTFSEGSDLEKRCQRKPDGYTCTSLLTGGGIQETWHWNVWANCSAAR